MEMSSIGFLTLENVCLALKIKALSHLEAEIWGNIRFTAAILFKWLPFKLFDQV